jgi:hypothetical protein
MIINVVNFYHIEIVGMINFLKVDMPLSIYKNFRLILLSNLKGYSPHQIVINFQN